VSGKATGARAGSLFSLAAQMLTEVQLDNPSRVVEMLTQALTLTPTPSLTPTPTPTPTLAQRKPNPNPNPSPNPHPNQRLSAMESSASTSGSYASSGLGGRLSLAGHVDEIMGGLSAMGTAREALAQAQADWPSLLARLERMRAALLVPDGAIINLSADAPSMAAALKHVPSFLAALPSDEAPPNPNLT
jgi:Zn-dependent M16 (insulinase) family peptidase